MFCRPFKVAVSMVLICSVSACTSTKLSSERIAGAELSKTVLEKRTTDSNYFIKDLDMYNVQVFNKVCSADYMKSESKAVNRDYYETKNCSAVPLRVLFAYPLMTAFSFGIYPVIDILTGFSLSRKDKFFDCDLGHEYKLEDAQGTITREFLDVNNTTCTTTPVTTGTVEVAYGEESFNLKPLDMGVVRLPLRHIGHLENLDKKTTIVWQYEGYRVTTVSNSTPAQRQETVKNYLNKLNYDKIFTMQLNDRSGFYKPDNRLMDEIRKELPKYYRFEKIANLPPGQKAANHLAKSDNAVDQSSDAQRSMNRLAKSENMVASADEQSAYRLVPTQSSVFFKSGDYTGNIELPVIDYNEAPKPVEVKTNIMSRKVNSLLPAYQNEDRNMKVVVKDTNMTLTNKTDRIMRLNKMSLYYNGKFVDNILERPMELAPNSTTNDIPLSAVVERDLGLLAQYGSLNAQQAQKMKINFGLGASYLDPQTDTAAMMNKVNTYSVYDMVNNMSETARLDDHMLSLIDEKNIPSLELREMFSGSLKAADSFDPTTLQCDLNVEFDTGKAEIKQAYLSMLEKVGTAMKKFPELKGVIEGHSDNVGTEEFNQKLSERRALAVKLYLVQTYGIDPGRIQAEGFGMSRPVADNDVASGRSQNRRIEGRIIPFGA
jgi:outer membrane protein OmpA-like peptidoglycan-associated protein